MLAAGIYMLEKAGCGRVTLPFEEADKLGTDDATRFGWERRDLPKSLTSLSPMCCTSSQEGRADLCDAPYGCKGGYCSAPGCCCSLWATWCMLLAALTLLQPSLSSTIPVWWLWTSVVPLAVEFCAPMRIASDGSSWKWSKPGCCVDTEACGFRICGWATIVRWGFAVKILWGWRREGCCKCWCWKCINAWTWASEPVFHHTVAAGQLAAADRQVTRISKQLII